MKYELKSIGYWSLVKISFVVNFFMGLVIGFFMAIFMGLFLTAMSNFGSLGSMGLPEGQMPSIGASMIIYPLMFAFGGAVFNTILYAIIAFVYNMTAKGFGGVEFEVAEVKPVYYAPLQPQYGQQYNQQSYAPQAPPPMHDPRSATPPGQTPPGKTTAAPPPPPPPPPVEPYPGPATPQQKDSGENKPGEEDKPAY